MLIIPNISADVKFRIKEHTARDRPSPYGETEVALQTVARGLSPAIAAWRGTGPRPTVRGGRFFIVARGPVPRELHGQKVAF